MPKKTTENAKKEQSSASNDDHLKTISLASAVGGTGFLSFTNQGQDAMPEGNGIPPLSTPSQSIFLSQNTPSPEVPQRDTRLSDKDSNSLANIEPLFDLTPIDPFSSNNTPSSNIHKKTNHGVNTPPPGQLPQRSTEYDFQAVEYSALSSKGRKKLSLTERAVNSIIFPREVGDNKLYFKKARKGKPTYVIFPAKDENPEDIVKSIENDLHLMGSGDGFVVCSYNYGEPANEADIYNTADAVENLLERNGIKREQTNIIGMSIGTAAATYLASKKTYRNLTLVDPFTSMNDVIKDNDIAREVKENILPTFAEQNETRNFARRTLSRVARSERATNLIEKALNKITKSDRAKSTGQKALSKFTMSGNGKNLLDNTNNIRNIPKETKITIVDHTDDLIVPTKQHKKCYHEAKKRDPSAILVEEKGGHLSSSGIEKTITISSTLDSKRDHNIDSLPEFYKKITSIRRDTIEGNSLRDLYLKQYALKNSKNGKTHFKRHTEDHRNIADQTKREINQCERDYELNKNTQTFIKLYSTISSAPINLITQKMEETANQIHTLLARLEEISSDKNSGVDIRVKSTHVAERTQKRRGNFTVQRKLEKNDFHNLFKCINHDIESAYNPSNYNWFLNNQITVNYSQRPVTIRYTNGHNSLQFGSSSQPKLFERTVEKKDTSGKENIARAGARKAEAEAIVRDIKSLTSALGEYKDLAEKTSLVGAANNFDFDKLEHKEAQKAQIKESKKQIEQCEQAIAEVEKKYEQASERADKLFFKENHKENSQTQNFEKLIQKERAKEVDTEKNKPTRNNPIKESELGREENGKKNLRIRQISGKKERFSFRQRLSKEVPSKDVLNFSL